MALLVDAMYECNGCGHNIGFKRRMFFIRMLSPEYALERNLTDTINQPKVAAYSHERFCLFS